MALATSFRHITPRFLGTFLVLLVFSFLLELSTDPFNLKTFIIACIPGFLLLVALIVAWIMQGIGALLYFCIAIAGIAYPISIKNAFEWGYAIMPACIAFIGFLFLVTKPKKQRLIF
ncbi:MAG: hypothetical protein PHY34_04535 [Patescibacteria group bacterium]|nr:hypothetical protein [Patescibacteria group bacterium]